MSVSVRPAAVLLAAAAAAVVATRPAETAVTGHDLPFVVGETLHYSADLGRFGGSGRGTMRVEGVDTVRGRITYLLHSDLRGRVAGFKAEDHTRSWLDPVRMVSLRFQKRERHPFSSFREAVELYPDRGWWVTAEDSGSLDTSAPLDELSFLYFVRTLPLADGERYEFARHFDPARNPTTLTVIGRETITVPAGRFQTVVVEMRVRDERRYGGVGTVQLHLTDDERRIPVRIASKMRLTGWTVLSLEAVRGPS